MGLDIRLPIGAMFAVFGIPMCGMAESATKRSINVLSD